MGYQGANVLHIILCEGTWWTLEVAAAGTMNKS